MSDKCIINLATGRYVVGQDRLRVSLGSTGFDGEFLAYTAEHQIGADLHKDNPYSFKINAFREAERQGFRFVLWLDASVWAVKNIQPIFDHIKEHGYIMQYAGFNCGDWTNQNALDYFNITREEASKMKMYGNAGFLGLDLYDLTATNFLIFWERAMLAGAFKGNWSDHRHDMACGSIVANKLRMEYQHAEEWLNYGTEPKSDKVYLLAQGL